MLHPLRMYSGPRSGAVVWTAMITRALVAAAACKTIGAFQVQLQILTANRVTFKFSLGRLCCSFCTILHTQEVEKLNKKHDNKNSGFTVQTWMHLGCIYMHSPYCKPTVR